MVSTVTVEREMGELRAAASDYCELFETAKTLGSERFLRRLARILPRLQAAAVQLNYQDSDEEEWPDLRLSPEDLQVVAWPVREVLDQVDWSRIEGDLHESVVGGRFRRRTHWPIGLFLYDDLTDVYLDLKPGLRRIQVGGAQAEREAAWEWRLNFWGHWGYHNAEARRVIHYYVALYLDG
jgi:hypothetical protein